jgi:hypothetical protein
VNTKENIITFSCVLQWGHIFDINFLSKIVLFKTVESVEQCSYFSITENIIWGLKDVMVSTVLHSVIWHVWGMGCAGYMNLLVAWEKLFNRLPIQSQNNMFSLYFFHDSLPRWNSRLIGERPTPYICCNVITNSAKLYCNGTCVRVDNE